MFTKWPLTSRKLFHFRIICADVRGGGNRSSWKSCFFHCFNLVVILRPPHLKPAQLDEGAIRSRSLQPPRPAITLLASESSITYVHLFNWLASWHVLLRPSNHYPLSEQILCVPVWPSVAVRPHKITVLHPAMQSLLGHIHLFQK